MSAPAGFIRGCGLALVAGGALTALLNLALTPLLPAHAPFAQVAASLPFLLRQSFSALAAVLLLVGAVGLYLAQPERAGRFGAIAFAATFLGSALLLATEWAEVFLVRTLALRAPAALAALESRGMPTLYDLGAVGALAVFSLGWIALALVIVRTETPSRAGAWLVVAGLFAIPLLGAIAGPWGAVAGNVVLGAGWITLGRALTRA
jgi:hypothetical protein